MEKVIVVIMGQNCEKFIRMCLDSVEQADKIIYCDGGSTDGTVELVGKTNPNVVYIKNEYDQDDLAMNGKQRNFYLTYLKENYSDDWCLVLDADEVVEDLTNIKEFIQKASVGLYNVHMRHLIQDLTHEDATHEKHWVPFRLFKISEATTYPEVEHPVLEGNRVGQTDCTCIWHLAYIPNLWDIKKRYENHMKKSNMHTPDFLKNWYYSHIFGTYPTKQFNPVELPDIILNEFKVDKDELYFANRGLEHKHWIDAVHHKDFFGLGDNGSMTDVIEFGCGRGPRLYTYSQIGVFNVRGIEISKFAIKNKLYKDIEQMDITNDLNLKDRGKLILAYDVLEHISYNKIDTAINNLIRATFRYILVSVPVIGDPNLELDSTHKIKETKEWWIKQFIDKGLKLIETPNHFLFKEQVIIFSK